MGKEGIGDSFVDILKIKGMQEKCSRMERKGNWSELGERVPCSEYCLLGNSSPVHKHDLP